MKTRNLRDYPVIPAVLLFTVSLVQAQITDVQALKTAVNHGAPGETIMIGPGTFELTEPLRPQNNMTIRGAGIGVTIILGAESWSPGTADLPEHGTDATAVNYDAYLFNLEKGIKNVTLSDMTLIGPQLHGAVVGDDCDGLEMYQLHIEDFLWSSIRTFRMQNAKIHDNVFVNAGGSFNGISGGAFYLSWVKHSRFWNNRIFRTGERNFHGIKGRQIQHCRIHHNTVAVNFSIEFLFELDEYNEIDHNAFWGSIAIARYSGGRVFEEGHSFHIHHNWLQNSYSFQWPRNSTIIESNFFDFRTEADHGNLISNYASETSPGPTTFRNNLIRNPGRGIFWSQGATNGLNFTNNHIRTNTTITPRTEGLFGFPTTTDFSTVVIKDNIIECNGVARPLMRNQPSYQAVIENNTLVNVSDSGAYDNPNTGARRGPLEPLDFYCGVNNEFHIQGWQARCTRQ